MPSIPLTNTPIPDLPSTNLLFPIYHRVAKLIPSKPSPLSLRPMPAVKYVKRLICPCIPRLLPLGDHFGATCPQPRRSSSILTTVDSLQTYSTLTSHLDGFSSLDLLCSAMDGPGLRAYVTKHRDELRDPVRALDAHPPFQPRKAKTLSLPLPIEVRLDMSSRSRRTDEPLSNLFLSCRVPSSSSIPLN